MADEVTVGSLESQARGAGARKNSGKPELWQFPWWVLLQMGTRNFVGSLAVSDSRQAYAESTLIALANWQRGAVGELEAAFFSSLHGLAAAQGHAETSIRTLVGVVRVLEFGAKKYAPGNWAKGMSWNVCFSCAMSHLTKILAGEDLDEESGLPHEAHLLCNIVFLLGYRNLYPEGDDRLPMFRPGGVKS